MTKQRYTVGSVTGYAITDSEGRQGRRLSSIWYVYDRLNGYSIVREFKLGVNLEKNARALAEKLNAGTWKPKQKRTAVRSETHCKNGHEWTPWNTYVTKRGYKECRKCQYDSNLRRAERKKAAA